MLLNDVTLCMHVSKMQRSVLLSSGLELARGYSSISLLASLQSYVVLVFY